MASTRPAPPDLLETLSRLTPLVGLAAGGAYALGYVIVNMYLARFGVGSLNLVQARYFTTGLLYVGLSALSLSSTVAGVQALSQPAAGSGSLPGPARVGLMLAADLLLTAVIIWAAGQVLTGVDRDGPFVTALPERRINFWAGLTASQIALAFPLAVGWGLRRLAGQLRAAAPAPPSWLGFNLLTSSLLAVCAAISLFVFAVFVYPAVSPAFGGGAPIHAQLVLKQPATADALGLPLTAGLTEPLTLIDQTETRLMVLDPHNRLIEFALDDLATVVRP